jgi:hypothetical protein
MREFNCGKGDRATHDPHGDSFRATLQQIGKSVIQKLVLYQPPTGVSDPRVMKL